MSHLNNVKIGIVSFGTASWENALSRLNKQARDSNIFNKFIFLNTQSLNKRTGYLDKNIDFISKNKFGHGYYLWKPYVIEWALENAPECDYILYVDSGSELNINENTINRFLDYVNVCEKNNIFYMQSRAHEIEMTHCNVINRVFPAAANTRQMVAGILMFKNNAKSLKIVKEWKDLCLEDNYSTLLPKTGKCCEQWTGIELADQSILSCLLKKHGIPGISDESDWYHSGYSVSTEIDESIKKYPLFAARNQNKLSVIGKCLAYKEEIRHIKTCKNFNQNKLCEGIVVTR
jgi:hypothetical protein